MKHLRSALAGLLALVLAPAAIAQQFPTVPDRTVIGRVGTGSGSGPSQAIPFAALSALLQLNVGVTTIVNGTDKGFFYDQGGLLGNSSILTQQVTAGSYSFIGIGDNIASGIARSSPGKGYALMIDRVVNWTGINDNTVIDVSDLTAQDSVSNQYASFAVATRTTNTAFNWTHITGFEDLKNYVGSGTLANDWSFLSNPTATGPVTARKAFYAKDMQGAGAVTTNTGFHCDALTRGTANWCFFATASTPSYLGGNVLIGSAGTAPTTPLLTLNKNAAAPTTPGANSLLQITNADGSGSNVEIRSFGTGAVSGFAAYAARGTAATPTAIQSGDVLTSWFGTGYGASAFSSFDTIIQATALENFTNTAHGTAWDFYTTPVTTASPALRLRIAAGLVGTSSSANAFASGPNGSTNPSFNVDASTASAATGLNVKSAAAAGGLALSVISSGSNENLTLDAKGSGTIGIGGTSTGAITLSRATTASVSISSPIHASSGALQFQSNGSTFAGNIDTSQRWVLGTNQTAQTGTVLTLTKNTAAPATAPNSASLLYLYNADATSTIATLDAYGTAVSPGMFFRQARGTAATPTQTQSSDNLFSFNVVPYNSTGGFSSLGQAILAATASQNCASGACGVYWQIYATANGSGTLQEKVRIQDGLMVGSFATDPGLGGLYLSGATITFNGLTTDATHTDRTVCQDTTSKSLFFGSGAAGICLGTSSARYKRDIRPLHDGLAEIVKLTPKTFYYLPGYGDDGAKRQYGLVAEDVVKVMPSIVGLNDKGQPNSVDWAALTPVMINAIAELKAANDNLKADVQSLKKRKNL